jgi:hypothetical protein
VASAARLAVAGLPSSLVAGAAAVVVVTAADAFGNTATGYSGTVRFTSTDSLAVLPLNYTFASADSGSHRFTVTLRTAGPQVVIATDVAESAIAGSQTVTATLAGTCPAPSGKAVLVDASHDGGVWWFPQAGGFDVRAPHQGKALADYLRSRGYTVAELGRDATVSVEALLAYPVVVRTGNYGAYAEAELGAYRQFAVCSRTLILLGEFLRDGQRDALANALGIPLTGWVNGVISTFARHTTTSGVASVPYLAGSVLAPGYDPAVQVLGWLASGEPVMGVLERGSSKIFFLGDVNGIEQVPQPLVSNLIAWGF